MAARPKGFSPAMDLHPLHFLLVAMWFGVVGAEVVLELLPLRRPELRGAADVLHYHIDLFVELPLLLGVVATGLLLLQGRALDVRLVVKLAGAALALGANFACVALVIARHRGRPELAGRRTKLVYLTALSGFPGGLLALYLGFGYAS